MIRAPPYHSGAVLSEPTVADRIALLVCLVMGSAAAASVANLPNWSFGQVDVLGSALSIAPGARSIVVGLLVVLTAAGIDDLIRAAPTLRYVSARYTATFWILPCLVTIAAATALPAQIANPSAWLASLVLLGALLLAVVVASYGTAVPGMRLQRAARLVLNVTSYGAAFALYATIYGWHVRSLLSATAVLLVTFPLALELLRGTEEQVATTWLYAGVVALVLGELTWILNAWGLAALPGGALLLLAFYSLVGISQQHLAGALTRRIVYEFLVVAVAGVAVILIGSLMIVQ